MERKIAIEIPNDYDLSKIQNGSIASKMVLNAVANGVLLPEGHWIEHKWAEEVDDHLISNFECSCCHTWKRDESNYCPDCGARMIDPWANGIERGGN